MSEPASSGETSITICRTDALDVVGELVPLLGEDRERGDFLVQPAGEIVDLRLRRVAPGEHAEVHPHLECGCFAVAYAECDRLFHQLSRGSHRNFNAATTNPVAPQAASTPRAPGFVQSAWLRKYTAFTMSMKYLSGSTSPIARRNAG